MSFESWLSERLVRTNEGRASADRGIFEAACPFCRTQERSFWFSLPSMRGGCLRKAKCGWRGDAVQLVMGLEGCSVREAVEAVRASGEALGVRRRSVIRRDQDGVADVCRLPAEFIALSSWVESTENGRAAWAYLDRRGVLLEQCLQHRIGYCIGGRYNDRVVVPVVERGEVAYFVARLFRGRGLKYRYPTTAMAGGRGPSDVLFNLDGVAGRPRVRVVEGVFDALAEERRGEAAVAMLGLAVSEVQAAKLALAGCREAVVECDGDAPLREVEKVARRLEGVMRVRVARPERDPDDADRSPTAGRWGIAERVRERLTGRTA